MNRRRKKGWALALALLALLTLGGCTQIPVTTQAPSYAPDANPWLIDGGTLKMPAGIFWPLVALLTLGFLALCFYAYKRAQRMARLGETPYDALALGCAFALAFTLRAVLAMVFAGHPTDIACVSVWSLRMVEVGPADFYIPTLFCDYPPGYFYLNYPFAAMVKLFGLAYQSPFTTLLIKMPAILADLALAYVLMRVVSARYGRAQGSLAALLVLFNPCLLYTSRCV